MITASKPTEEIDYYNQRLEFIKTLFREHQSELLNKNSNKIKNLIDEYKFFKEDKKYKPSLAKTIELFILN